MTITNLLDTMILRQFGTRKAFAAAAGIHPGILERMLRDGIDSSNTRNVYKLCRCLGISMDGLMEGKIVYLKKKTEDDSQKPTTEQTVVQVNLMSAVAALKAARSGENFEQHIYVPSKTAYVPEHDENDRIAEDLDLVIFRAENRPKARVRK